MIAGTRSTRFRSSLTIRRRSGTIVSCMAPRNRISAMFEKRVEVRGAPEADESAHEVGISESGRKVAVGEEALVGVDVENPLARGEIEPRVAGRREVGLPGVLGNDSAERLGDAERGVCRPCVDDDDLIDDGSDRRQTVGKVVL